MAPRYRAPPLPVPDVWPIPATTATSDPATASATAVSVGLAAAGNPGGAAAAALADVGWRDFFVDARLQSLIAQALANNRDLRIAVLNVEHARAQYRIQRAGRLPNIDAIGNFNKEKLAPALANGQSTSVNQYYEASVGVSAFEFDLFGRVASLSHAALEQYLAEEASRRSAQLSLIGEVANAYLTLASDRELQRLATGTLKSQQDSFELTQKRRDAGAASGLDLAQARTTVEAARADAARFDGNVAQDIDALTLLVGVTPDASALPTGFDVETASLTTPPVGLPSAVLLRRPDVVAAEHALRAANANIGAARAAFFPNISLMGDIGSASDYPACSNPAPAPGASHPRSRCRSSRAAGSSDNSAPRAPNRASRSHTMKKPSSWRSEKSPTAWRYRRVWCANALPMKRSRRRLRAPTSFRSNGTKPAATVISPCWIPSAATTLPASG
jgi:multidrug efflux system outer membrane protein